MPLSFPKGNPLYGCLRDHLLKPKFQSIPQQSHRNFFKRLRDPRSLAQLSQFMRAHHAEHATPCSKTCANPGRRILDDHALLRRQPQQLRPAPIRFRIGLAVLHHIAADNALRNRQPRRRQASHHKSSRRRGHNCPPFRRQPLKQRLCSGQHLKIARVLNLHVFDHTQPVGHLRFIPLRLQAAQNIHRTNAMRDIVAIGVRHAIQLAPPAPAAHYRSQRTDQYPIHIEQQPPGFNADLFRQFRLHRTAHAERPASTNARAASSTAVTDSVEQLSQYTRSRGSVPDARSRSHVSAAFCLPVQAGFSRKNLIPSIVSTRSTFIPAIVSPAPNARARAIADCFRSSSMCISMRPYWCSPNSACNAATSSPRVFFSSAITFASSSAFSKPSRSGRCLLTPTPPDSSPPIRISPASMKSTTYLKPIPCSCSVRPYFAAIRSTIFVVLNARVTSPGQPLRAINHSASTASILCASTTFPCSSTAPMRSASPSVLTPQIQR